MSNTWPTAKPDAFEWTEPAQVIDWVCQQLETGRYTLNMIRSALVPRIARQTLVNWRLKNPEWGERIDDSFEIGIDAAMATNLLIAEGAEGYSKGNTRRDKLIMAARTQLAEKWDRRRYGPRQTLENDQDNPVLPPQFIVQGVEAPKRKPDPTDGDELEEA
jgi:hypothetical protein